MKKTHFSKRAQAQLAKRSPSQPRTKMPGVVNVAKRPFLPRWALILLCLALGCGGVLAGTWVLAEFPLFSNLPPELLGKWVVHGGPQDGATFDFYRNGSMVARLNNNGREAQVKARVVVEDKKLLTTTQNPHTGQDETRTSVIQELTRGTLVLETEQGEVFRMRRAQ
jgi:uncharacterized protein (TIGR03066 family)